MPTAAGTIVDTGTPSDPFVAGSFRIGQYFGGQFTITDSYHLQTIEGYFSNDSINNAAGSVTIGVHSIGPFNSPDPTTLLYSAVINMAAGAPLGWYGVTGSNYLLGPGTYWTSFIPSAEIRGIMPGTVPFPLAEYAMGSNDFWYSNVPNQRDHFALGLRINAELAPSVPDATSTLHLLVAVALVGMVARRFS
jgi:hypothetical protein